MKTPHRELAEALRAVLRPADARVLGDGILAEHEGRVADLAAYHAERAAMEDDTEDVEHDG